MTYLSEIEEIIRRKIEEETADLRADRDRAVKEAEEARRQKTVSYRENHVMERIAHYRRERDAERSLREELQKKLDEATAAICELKPADDRTFRNGSAHPCPQCGHDSIVGLLYRTENGDHQHTTYHCTYWASLADGGERCGWSGWYYDKPGSPPVYAPGKITKNVYEWVGDGEPKRIPCIRTSNISVFNEEGEDVTFLLGMERHNDHLLIFSGTMEGRSYRAVVVE